MLPAALWGESYEPHFSEENTESRGGWTFFYISKRSSTAWGLWASRVYSDVCNHPLSLDTLLACLPPVQGAGTFAPSLSKVPFLSWAMMWRTPAPFTWGRKVPSGMFSHSFDPWAELVPGCSLGILIPPAPMVGWGAGVPDLMWLPYQAFFGASPGPKGQRALTEFSAPKFSQRQPWSPHSRL